MTPRHDLGEDAHFLEPGDAAALLGVSVRTLRRWEDRGLIASTRTLGRHRRFKQADVDAALTGLAAQTERVA